MVHLDCSCNCSSHPTRLDGNMPVKPEHKKGYVPMHATDPERHFEFNPGCTCGVGNPKVTRVRGTMDGLKINRVFDELIAD